MTESSTPSSRRDESPGPGWFTAYSVPATRPEESELPLRVPRLRRVRPRSAMNHGGSSDTLADPSIQLGAPPRYYMFQDFFRDGRDAVEDAPVYGEVGYGQEPLPKRLRWIHTPTQCTLKKDQDSASDLTASSSFNESFEDDFSEDEQSNVHATKTSSGTSNQECPVSFFTFGDTPRAYSRALRNGNDNESPPPLLLPSPTSTAHSTVPKQNEGISPKKRFMDRYRQTSLSDQYAEQRGMDVGKNS
jgi:hypothetical protein